MKLLGVLLLVCWFLLRAEDHTCKTAIVDYEAVTALVSVPDGKLTTTTQTIGCVDIQGQTVLVIRTLSSGKAIDAIAIPAGSVNSITLLEVHNDSPTSPKVLPNVQNEDDSRNTGTQSGGTRVMRFLQKGGLL